jgi:ligand-binding SRPBCC domain-containing protein
VKTYQLKKEQTIPISLAEAWDFFSSPLNLAKITPPEMNFVVTSDYAPDTKMYEGMLITYTITPLLGIKMRWMTEITHVKDCEYFVDEQRFGPYALWHHEHHFKEIEGGVVMNDILNYAIPFGPMGQLANTIFVGKKVRDIFEYRVKAIDELFGRLEWKA